MTHLWEVNHPYYCNEGNYFAAGDDQPYEHFESWTDFLESWGDADLDYNLLFRWDWRKADAGIVATGNRDDATEWGNEKDQLLLFFMGQRKGRYSWVTIDVEDEDEVAVREYLTARWEHLNLLWRGISETKGHFQSALGE